MLTMSYNAEYHKKYREENKAKIVARKKACYEARKDYYKIKSRKYSIENKEAQNKSKRKSWNKKYKNDPSFKLAKNISHQIYLAVRKKKAGRKWENIVGYSLQELKNHLELLFEHGMTWENQGDWHIDHINPVCSFDLNNTQQFENCWKLENLRPLWKHQNLSKASKDKKLKL